MLFSSVYIEIVVEPVDSPDTNDVAPIHKRSSVWISQLSIDRPVDTQNEILRAIRDEQCNVQSQCICDYVDLKGLPKSGTSWMLASLKQIQSYFCDQRGLRGLFHLEICIDWHVASYLRHRLVLAEKNDHPALLKHFGWRNKYLSELKRKRFCTVTVFRDPRDRGISLTHWKGQWKLNRMKGKEAKFKYVNENMMARYKDDIEKYNEWWIALRTAEITKPMRYYNFFYDEMVINTFQAMKELVEFIGFHHIDGVNMTDQDIENIVAMTSHEALGSQGAKLLYRKGQVCAFHDELTLQNANKIQQITLRDLNPTLVAKFNGTCIISR